MASTRSARDVWKQLVDEAGEDLIEQAASVSVAQAEKELRAYGFDVEAERARARAFLEELVHGTGQQHVAEAQPAMAPPAPRRKRRPVVWLAAAAAAAVGGGALYVALHERPIPAPAPPETTPEPSAPSPVAPPGPDLVAAADWRNKAIAACDASQWQECLADLDIARAIDPEGDDTPLVKSTRKRAIDGILRKPLKPPTTPKP